MINESYIKDMQNANLNLYSKILSNPIYLDKIRIEYLKKYGNESNAYFLALKESVDHYVAQRIHEDKNYVDTMEFKNYFDYIKKIVIQNAIVHEKNRVYLELSTNVVFEYLDEKKLEKIAGKNYIKYNMDSNYKYIKFIMNKIGQNQSISNEEIKLLSTYFDNKKDFKNPEFKKMYQNFMKYVMENRQKLKSSPQLISSILTFLPSYYGNGVEDVRSFLAKYDHISFAEVDNPNKKNKVYCAHSSGIYKYTAFEIDEFKDIQLESNKSLNSSRTLKEKDFMFLLFVQFHELTHQVQKNNVVNQKFNINAVPYEITRLLKEVYNDYLSKFYGPKDPRNFEGNHDSDEIEIDADKTGWIKLGTFITKFMGRNDESLKLSRMCDKNAKAVNCRRAFSVKENPLDRKKYRTMDYDMYFLCEAVKKNPQILNKYHHLKHIVNSDGELDTSILFEDRITLTDGGRTISNYILDNAPLQVLIEKINSNMYSTKQIVNLLENFVEVPHANALYLRNLKNVDLATFNETRSKYNLTEKNLDEVYSKYFYESTHQLLKYSQILEQVRGRFDDEYINSCYEFFFDYYKEMLQEIKCPNSKQIELCMGKFLKSKNPILNNIAQSTVNYVKNKKSVPINSAYINAQYQKVLKNDSVRLNNGIVDISRIVNSLQNNFVTIGGQDEGIR